MKTNASRQPFPRAVTHARVRQRMELTGLRSALGLVATLVVGPMLPGADQPGFAGYTIATGLPGGYQVVPCDLNKDGRPDLIALATGLSELVWFENPSWERHVIAAGFTRLINLAVLNPAGRFQIMLASGFANEAKNSAGNIWVLDHAGDVRQPWKIREIDRLPTSHRMRLADIDGSGGPVVISAPLTAADAVGPDYRGRTPLVYYRPGEWRRVLISDENEGVVHGLCIVDWDGDGRDDILTASFGGIHRHELQADGRWVRSEVCRGGPATWPKCGASDVAVVNLGGRRLLATIEPWHGNQVVVYRENQGRWDREVIDDSFREGHALAVADLDKDGREEIIAGYRLEGGGLFIYRAEDGGGARWRRNDLDTGGMAASACSILDLDGDDRMDIVAIGSATANLKWYRNKNQ